VSSLPSSHEALVKCGLHEINIGLVTKLLQQGHDTSLVFMDPDGRVIAEYVYPELEVTRLNGHTLTVTYTLLSL
jgi:hypothetical protein